MDHGINAVVIVAVAACLAGWGAVSARMARWNVTGPLAFMVLGLVLTHGPLAVAHLQLHSSTILSLVELTLAVVLFGDASRVNVKALRHGVALPVRLLLIGLPLSVGAGAALAAATVGGGLWVAAAVGAIVAPTDAALGAGVMGDRRVPVAVRRTLNIESGLNDGIVTPFVNLFLAGALSSEAVSAGGVGQAAIDLLGGAAVGVGVGVAGGVAMHLARRARWSSPSFRPLSVLSLAVLAYAAAVLSGTNGFVAAFVAGMAFGSVVPQGPAGEDGQAAEDTDLRFTEEAGELLSLLVWFVFGAVMLVPGVRAASWRDLVFALLALTVARMVPVAVALWGAGTDRATVAFVGWFGPRGLASIVFALIAVDALDPSAGTRVLGAVSVTVALSVVAHGMSAGPLAARYGRAASALAASAPEHQDHPPVRARPLRGAGPTAAQGTAA